MVLNSNTKHKVYRKVKRVLTAIEHWRVFKLQKRLGISPDLYLQLSQPWLMTSGIRTVLDIGAHTGTWARTVHHLMPNAEIYSFEPIPVSFKMLQEKMQGISAHKAFNVALGEESGEAVFNLNDFSPASSLHRMSPSHTESFPFTAKSRPITVQVERLDDLISADELEKEILIKVDVQGFEDKVISGGRETFKKAKILLIEVSFEKLYEGQPLFGDIYAQLLGFGFRYAGNIEQLLDPHKGNILQADAVFINDTSK